MNRTDVVDALREERDKLIVHLEKQPSEGWVRPTPCAGWNVRDVVAHLVGNAADVLAQRLEGAGSEEYNQRQVDERAGLSPEQILAEWREKGPQLDALFSNMTEELWATEIPGIGEIGAGVERLLEDLWVHAQDVRIGLGDVPEPGPGLRATLEVIGRELLERCRRLAAAPASVEIAAGDFATTVAVGGTGPALRVEGDPVALGLVGTGRRTLDQARAEGGVTVSPEPPRGFAEALNIYSS